MILKNLILTGLIMSIVFSGCNKDKKEDTFEELSIDNDETEAVATNDESDAIFDEFYEESKPENQDEIPPPENLKKVRTQSQPQFFPNGRYVIQVSCVQSKNFARKIAIKLEDKGYPAYIAEVEDPAPNLKGLYHRVRIGGFSSYKSAKTFGEDYLTADGFKYWVDNRTNDNIGFANLGSGSKSAGKEHEISSTSEQPEPAPETPAAGSKTESVKQEQVSAPSSVTTPLSSDVPEQSSQTKPPEESKEMVSEQTPQPNQVETPDEPLVQPTPAHNISSESSEPAKSSDSFETSEEDDDWGELDEEWGSDTTDW